MQFKEEKADLVRSGKYDEMLAECWRIYSNTGVVSDLLPADYFGISAEKRKAFDQLRNAKRTCWCRLKDHLDFWVSAGYPIVFGTLTFKDEVLMSTSAKTRREYVQRFLKKEYDDYIANIDFGDENDREHYHYAAVPYINDRLEYETYGKKNNRIKVISGGIDEYSQKYGLALVKPVRPKSEVRVAGYVAKLCNHSIKVKQTKIMTKKGSPYQIKRSADRHFQKKMEILGGKMGYRKAFVDDLRQKRDETVSLAIYHNEQKSVLDALEEI